MDKITVSLTPLGEASAEGTLDCRHGEMLIIATRFEQVDGQQVITAAYMGDWAGVADILQRWMFNEEDD